MTSLDMHYALSFVFVEHSVCHEPIFVLIWKMKIMTEFVPFGSKTYSYLIDDGKSDKKAKGTKKIVIKRKDLNLMIIKIA